jgi:hypothetical protein
LRQLGRLLSPNIGQLVAAVLTIALFAATIERPLWREAVGISATSADLSGSTFRWKSDCLAGWLSGGGGDPVAVEFEEVVGGCH